MKKLVLFLFLIAFVFAGSFLSARWVRLQKNAVASIEKGFLDNGFKANPYPLKNHPFVIVIIGANNGASLQKTLDSVFSQNYEHFRVVYIDDASDDGSFELARDLIYDSKFLADVTLAHNEEKLGVLANLFRAVQSCKDEEIVVVLHGEDWLAHEWVLQRLNAYYADPDLWLTYGQYRDFPNFQAGSCRPFRLQDWKEHGFRGHSFITSHLKTFYAGLFKKIREGDFIYQGKFLPAHAEMAYMVPMLEMAKEHFQFIPEILYISNRGVPQKEDRDLLMRCERFVRSLNTYSTLALLSFDSESEKK